MAAPTAVPIPGMMLPMAAPEMAPDRPEESTPPASSPKAEPIRRLATSWAASPAIWPRPALPRAASMEEPPCPAPAPARLSALLMALEASSMSFSTCRACLLTMLS